MLGLGLGSGLWFQLGLGSGLGLGLGLGLGGSVKLVTCNTKTEWANSRMVDMKITFMTIVVFF